MGSAAYKADEEVYLATLKFRGTPRWDLARADADLDSPGGPAAFSCAVGTPVSPEMTPRVIRLMETVKADAGRTNSYTKKHYLRTRPFVVFGESTCMKDAEPFLKSNGSYPSAHATIGWTWALILAEMVPARAERILERGLSYGESRVICGVHWQSDIDAGRLLGSAVTARLHGDPLFRAELQAAGEELRAAREKGHTPLQDCRAEDAILKTGRR